MEEQGNWLELAPQLVFVKLLQKALAETQGIEELGAILGLGLLPSSVHEGVEAEAVSSQ